MPSWQQIQWFSWESTDVLSLPRAHSLKIAGYAVGLQYAAKRNIVRAKCIVCATNPTVDRATALPARYVPAPLGRKRIEKNCLKQTAKRGLLHSTYRPKIFCSMYYRHKHEIVMSWGGAGNRRRFDVILEIFTNCRRDRALAYYLYGVLCERLHYSNTDLNPNPIDTNSLLPYRIESLVIFYPLWFHVFAGDSEQPQLLCWCAVWAWFPGKVGNYWLLRQSCSQNAAFFSTCSLSGTPFANVRLATQYVRGLATLYSDADPVI